MLLALMLAAIVGFTASPASALTERESAVYTAVRNNCGPGYLGNYCRNRIDGSAIAGWLVTCHGGGYKCYSNSYAYEERTSVYQQWERIAIHVHVNMSTNKVSYYDECSWYWSDCNSILHV